ncbi:hypothetical protein [Oxalobacter paraformigenes]|uniref:hypothetical protein n=1 Tax=Oxalobacter paraformigenes TaxID=556268 RepID=UPI0012DCEA0B|nr:hypothetical protein [Oxalobacter paraformigenes]
MAGAFSAGAALSAAGAILSAAGAILSAFTGATGAFSAAGAAAKAAEANKPEIRIAIIFFICHFLYVIFKTIVIRLDHDY